MKKWKLIALLSILAASPLLYADITPSGDGTAWAGIKSEEFSFSAAQQHKPNWCWAACVQMVLNYHGLVVSQEEVVQRIFGDQIDQPGQPNQILSALSGWAHDINHRPARIMASPYVANGMVLVNDLAYKWPLIVGLKNPGGIGHALVLTAIHYAPTPMGPQFISVVLRDPWPTNPSRQELSWGDFQQRLMFMARVTVIR